MQKEARRFRPSTSSGEAPSPRFAPLVSAKGRNPLPASGERRIRAFNRCFAESERSYNLRMRVIGLAGWSGAGKTTLLVQLIPELDAPRPCRSRPSSTRITPSTSTARQGSLRAPRGRRPRGAGRLAPPLGPDARAARRARARRSPSSSAPARPRRPRHRRGLQGRRASEDRGAPRRRTASRSSSARCRKSAPSPPTPALGEAPVPVIPLDDIAAVADAMLAASEPLAAVLAAPRGGSRRRLDARPRRFRPSDRRETDGHGPTLQRLLRLRRRAPDPRRGAGAHRRAIAPVAGAETVPPRRGRRPRAGRRSRGAARPAALRQLRRRRLRRALRRSRRGRARRVLPVVGRDRRRRARSSGTRRTRRRGAHLHRRAHAGRVSIRSSCRRTSAAAGDVVLPPGLKRGANRRLAGEDIARGAPALRGRPPPDAARHRAPRRARPRRGRRCARRCASPCSRPATRSSRPASPRGRRRSTTPTASCCRRCCAGSAARVTDLGILPDEPRDASPRALAGAAADHDLIITSGGVSTGEEDHVKAAVESAGALTFWRLAIKPGRPVAMGVVAGTPFIGLPGNPVAVFVTFAHVARGVDRAACRAKPSRRRAPLPVAGRLRLPQEGGAARIRARAARARRRRARSSRESTRGRAPASSPR